MGDQPYTDLVIDISRPDGSVIRRVSNLSGFANFGMKIADEERRDIYEPGTYEFRAKLPTGWVSILPEALHQTVQFFRREGVRSGMAPEKGCDHIGVTPALTVSGRIAVPEGTSFDDVTITVDDGSRKISAPMDESGNYSAPLDPGRWTLVAENRNDGGSVKRDIKVDSFSVVLSEINFPHQAAKPVGGDVHTIGFDDLTTSDTLREIPSGYDGFSWLYWVATHNKLYEGGGYINGTVSGEYIAYNSSGQPAAIWRDKPFDFVGVYIGAAWPAGEDEDVTVKAWRGDEIVYQDMFPISNAGAAFFSADYLAVDKIEFSLANYERIVIDDLKVRY